MALIEAGIQMDSELHYVNDKWEGISKFWSEDGTILQDGLRGTGHTYLKTYYANGQMKREEYSVGGQLEDNTKEYYESGQIKSYINGKRNGTHRTWYENGQLQTSEYYEMNGFEGTHTHYYENGQKKFEKAFSGDEACGYSRAWDEQGELTNETFFVSDILLSSRFGN